MISEDTEITESGEATPLRGWIFYDRDCCTCRDLALRLAGVFARRGFKLEPLQEARAQQRLQLKEAQALEEMRVLTVDSEAFSGADAIIFLARQINWARPLARFASLPIPRSALHRAYRSIAAHRSCMAAAHASGLRGGAVPGKRDARATLWLPLALLPVLALLTKPLLPAWAFMWAMAFALFFGCKWLTLGLVAPRAGGFRPFRATAYLLAWPGMDARRFLAPDLVRVPKAVLVRSAALGAIRFALGILLLFGIARYAPDPLLTGWIGMIGMILILHVGLFELVSAGWRAAGVDAPPIMNAPLRSRSVREFWGRRWNAAFNDLAFDLVFQPVARRAGTTGATFAAFGASGVIHELVISLPAGAGYGLPSAYFLLQALGVFIERRPWVRGRLFTLLCVAAPAFWLFHPPFVRRVVLPFMQTIGAS